MHDIVVMTDFSSTEGSTIQLRRAVELLADRSPTVLDARYFYDGGGGRATCVDSTLTLEVSVEDVRVQPSVVVVYEIPPEDRYRFAHFQTTVERSRVSCLGRDAQAWRRATDKRRTAARFLETGIPRMDTISLENPSTALAAEAFERLGRDVWTRPAIGLGGRNVRHVTSVEQLHAAAQLYAATGDGWLLSRDAQNFDRRGHRHQYRIVVLGDQVLRVCEHVQDDPDAPCNEAQGAASTVLSPKTFSREMRDLAVNATRALGLPFGGVDLVPENGGVVFEVNVHPALDVPQGFEMVAVPYVRAHLAGRSAAERSAAGRSSWWPSNGR